MEETTGRLEEPILPGTGASDYERYLRTDELLALQKGPEERLHRDELLAAELGRAIRLLRRACHCLRFVTDQLEMLEPISPWEYHLFRRCWATAAASTRSAFAAYGG
jgi:tryptophan 2,3-dioxygenase